MPKALGFVWDQHPQTPAQPLELPVPPPEARDVLKALLAESPCAASKALLGF